ncbi:hypothetical protein GCM10007036_21930 [Alsobacter metallidurans]|uniref:Guanylate cyclase domain-containing protein n=1 Tax=Alsobacter metallidurans TaxID=340221 RepID=A0A917MH92_9HYPH|nr:CHASE2 domain-containing protein [Alsobacter metallidurans]GGH19219.1 hypothetical protein GCM10007036_21930 [Alsobacter metallidurans]
MTTGAALGKPFWRQRALSSAACFALVAACAAIGGWSGFSGPFSPLSGPNAPLYDLSAALLQHPDAASAWPNAVVLLIDQETLDGPPWSLAPRALQHRQLAELGRRALDLGARKVGFDLVLALDPADLAIAGADLRSFDAPLRALLERETDRVVIGSYPTVRPAQAYRDLVGPGGVGVVDLQAEEDGVVRSVATRLRLATGEIQAGFADRLAANDDDDLSVREQSRVLLFPGAPLRTAPVITVRRFESCLASADGLGRLQASLRNRVVLIGTGIVGEDLRRGPDRFMRQPAAAAPADPCAPAGLTLDFGDRNVAPGVLVQAAAVESAASARTPRLADPPARAAASGLMAAAAVLVFLGLSRRLARMPAERPTLFSTTAVAFAGVVAAIVGLAAAFLGVAALAVRGLGLWLPLGHTLMLVSAAGFMGAMTLAVRRDLALADLRRSFGRYLPAKVVAAALRRDDVVGGEERPISVLVADLRGFIQFCESRRRQPTAIIQALNAKFAAAQAVLDRYGATLDKFDGDAVIAFWNGVGEQPDHAARAVAAAIELIEQDALPGEDGGEGLRFKAAVASGLAFVGDYGSKQKTNFSAIGDPMNLAARLEGLCNPHGVPIVIAAETLEQARAAPGTDPAVLATLARTRFRDLGAVPLKGYTEPVRIATAEARCPPQGR